MPDPLISVIMPCYNAAGFLDKAIKSVVDQTEKNWELIVVNDGSTDNSEAIAAQWANADKRIRVLSKTNGGYVTARLMGYQQSSASRYLIFFDADDIIHPDFLATLAGMMEKDDAVGAAYTNHRIMDEHDRIAEHGIDMPRFMPTAFWTTSLPETEKYTPFISIFCWTKMIEPMTLIRREAYEQTPGWDVDFGKGKGNIGEGVYLFSEIALKWKVQYEPRPLYYYRRHSAQISSISDEVMLVQVNKVIGKWEERIKHEPQLSTVIEPAIVFLRYRLMAKKKVGSLKHQLRYHPLKAIGSMFAIAGLWLRSFPLAFNYSSISSLSPVLSKHISLT